jgi:hypothetical protein
MDAKAYKITPATLVLPTIPSCSLDPESRAILLHESTTDEVDWARIPALCDHTREIVREFRRQVRKRDWRMVDRMIKEYPALMMIDQVAETVSSLLQTGRFGTTRGRPHGSTTWPPMIVAGLVRRLCKTGQARSIDDALHKLAGAGLMTYDGLKKSYYRAMSNHFSRALLLEGFATARIMTPEEFEALSQEAVRPERIVVRGSRNPRTGKASS